METEQIYKILRDAYFSDQMHEKAVIEHLPQLLQHARVFVDIGASLGQYVYFANKCMDHGHIFCFEPDPIRFEQLQRSCLKWQEEGTNIITPIEAAIGDDTGTTIFYSSESNVSGSLIRHDTVPLGKSPREVRWTELKVKCLRLDDFLVDTIPNVVKIDVEGAELRVLRGASGLLKLGKTRFIVEVDSIPDPEGKQSPEEVFRFMRQRGYFPKNFYGRILFEKSRIPSARFVMHKLGDCIKGLMRLRLKTPFSGIRKLHQLKQLTNEDPDRG